MTPKRRLRVPSAPFNLPAERRSGNRLNGSKRALRRQQSHVKQFLQELFGGLDAELVVRRQFCKFLRKLLQFSHKTVVASRNSETIAPTIGSPLAA